MTAKTGAILTFPAEKEFAFEVGLIARARVRAPDEASARRVVPSVIGAPGAQDIALANQGIDVLLPGVMVTAVDFIPDRKVKLVRARQRPPSDTPDLSHAGGVGKYR